MKSPALRHLVLRSLALLCVALPAGASGQVQADRVLVIKSRNQLVLYNHGEILKRYRVSLGRKPGAKGCSGDFKTPEGHYIIDSRNPKSEFYKSLHISYPNETDAEKARKLGRDPGGGVSIHGLPKGLEKLGKAPAYYNWTKGCIAVSNPEMDEIWQLVPDGTPIDIVP